MPFRVGSALKAAAIASMRSWKVVSVVALSSTE